MYPVLFSCDFFTLYSFGLCIFIGYMLYLFLLEKDQVIAQFISQKDLNLLIFCALIAGVIGSRILCIVSQWNNYINYFDMIDIRQPGFSVLGAVIGICMYAFFVSKLYRFPLAIIADRAALYAPFTQAIGRIGCFLAGCCYGIPVLHAWGITYHDPRVLAPLGICLHPTQLYSSLILFCIGLFLYTYQKKITQVPGRLLLSYLILIGFERFMVDFWRDDRIMAHAQAWCSFDQKIALSIIAPALIVLLLISSRKASYYE